MTPPGVLPGQVPDSVRSAERALNIGTWLIVVGAMLYSVLTVTPLMLAHTPPGWEWTAPILPLVVDAAVVIVVRLDAVLARLGEEAGGWPVLLRWMTGLMTLGLNTADSALKADWVGVAVHAVAPLLLIVTAETGLAYRRAIAAALTRLEAEQREQAERERRERQQREQRDREEREAERAARERREREEREAAREEREHAARLERERLEHTARMEREAREHAGRMEREREERQVAREQAARDAQERRDREERERLRDAAPVAGDRQADGQADGDREHHPAPARPSGVHEQLAAPGGPRATAADERRNPVAPPAERVTADTGASRERPKMPESKAREAVRLGVASGASVRELATLTGWSLGWISNRIAELRDTPADADPVGVAR